MINCPNAKLSKYQVDRGSLVVSWVFCCRVVQCPSLFALSASFLRCSTMELEFPAWVYPSFPLSPPSQRSGCAELHICTHRPMHSQLPMTLCLWGSMCSCHAGILTLCCGGQYQRPRERPHRWKVRRPEGEETNSTWKWWTDRALPVVSVIPSLTDA